jgi:hypothetical protein
MWWFVLMLEFLVRDGMGAVGKTRADSPNIIERAARLKSR